MKRSGETSAKDRMSTRVVAEEKAETWRIVSDASAVDARGGGGGGHFSGNGGAQIDEACLKMGKSSRKRVKRILIRGGTKRGEGIGVWEDRRSK